MPPPVACYREFAPCEALRRHVRAFFSFTPPSDANPAHRAVTREVFFGENDSFCSPLFADAHTSIVFRLGRVCRVDGLWQSCPTGPHGIVIGARTAVGPGPVGELDEIVGVYFRAAQESPFTGAPAAELTDRIVALEDLWGRRSGAEFAFELSATTVPVRVDRLECVLLERIGKPRRSAGTLDIPGLASWAFRRYGRLTVDRLANAAGVSRQHLARVFRESVGVTPKLYCRLARFQSGLSYAGAGEKVDWAQVAIELGYTDQSHMIAEFREFSSLTPRRLTSREWFHPFIERARAGRSGRSPVSWEFSPSHDRHLAR